MDEAIKKMFLAQQKNEITEYHIYVKLTKSVKSEDNKKILIKISDDELLHYNFLKRHTCADVEPDKLRIWWYLLITRVLGLTFGIKLMENGEENAQAVYRQFAEAVPGLVKIALDEDEHEKALIGMIDEERLKYVGSIVLGLNDALVELTGALAGFTFALQESKLIAVVGTINL